MPLSSPLPSVFSTGVHTLSLYKELQCALVGLDDTPALSSTNFSFGERPCSDGKEWVEGEREDQSNLEMKLFYTVAPLSCHTARLRLHIPRVALPTNNLSSKHPVKEYILGRQTKWLCFSTCLRKLWFKWAVLLPDVPIWVALITIFIVNEFHLCLHDWLRLEPWGAAVQMMSLLPLAHAALLPWLSQPADLHRSPAAGMCAVVAAIDSLTSSEIQPFADQAASQLYVTKEIPVWVAVYRF